MKIFPDLIHETQQWIEKQEQFGLCVGNLTNLIAYFSLKETSPFLCLLYHLRCVCFLRSNASPTNEKLNDLTKQITHLQTLPNYPQYSFLGTHLKVLQLEYFFLQSIKFQQQHFSNYEPILIELEKELQFSYLEHNQVECLEKLFIWQNKFLFPKLQLLSSMIQEKEEDVYFLPLLLRCNDLQAKILGYFSLIETLKEEVSDPIQINSFFKLCIFNVQQMVDCLECWSIFQYFPFQLISKENCNNLVEYCRVVIEKREQEEHASTFFESSPIFSNICFILQHYKIEPTIIWFMEHFVSIFSTTRSIFCAQTLHFFFQQMEMQPKLNFLILFEETHDSIFSKQLSQLILSNQDVKMKLYAILLLGDVFQNPDVFTSETHYFDFVHSKIQFFNDQGCIDVLIQAIKSSTPLPSSTSGINSNNIMIEFQFICLWTLSQLIGFYEIRNKIFSNGGEKFVFHPLLMSSFNGMRELATKAIKLFRIFIDYGDRMNQVLLTKFKIQRQQHDHFLEYKQNQTPSAQSNKDSIPNALESDGKDEAYWKEKMNQLKKYIGEEEAKEFVEKYKFAHMVQDREVLDTLDNIMRSILGVAAFMTQEQKQNTPKKKSTVSTNKDKFTVIEGRVSAVDDEHHQVAEDLLLEDEMSSKKQSKNKKKKKKKTKQLEKKISHSASAVEEQDEEQDSQDEIYSELEEQIQQHEYASFLTTIQAQMRQVLLDAGFYIDNSNPTTIHG